MGPHPAVAAIRLAVRRVLHDILREHSAHSDQPHSDQPPSGRPRPGRPRSDQPRPEQRPLVLVACSGGADSMALASAVAFEAPRLGLRAGAVTIDHGLQPGSAERAGEVAARLTALRFDPVETVTVAVGREGGPEAAARDARYAALDAAAERHGAVAVLLGHTRDDQAETVLLGLARGSGTRSLAGMAAVSGPHGRYRRPFLAVDRQSTRRACMVQSLPVWDDPHNADPAYTRSRVRHEALPILEKALGKGVIEALARTARLSRDDADALDAWTDEAERSVRATPLDQSSTAESSTDQSSTAQSSADPAAAGPSPVVGPRAGELDVARLRDLPPAVRRRVLRRTAIAAGAPAGSLFAQHIEEVDRLITAWHGQRAINLPGLVEASRQGGRLVIRQN